MLCYRNDLVIRPCEILIIRPKDILSQLSQTNENLETISSASVWLTVGVLNGRYTNGVPVRNGWVSYPYNITTVYQCQCVVYIDIRGGYVIRMSYSLVRVIFRYHRAWVVTRSSVWDNTYLRKCVATILSNHSHHVESPVKYSGTTTSLTDPWYWPAFLSTKRPTTQHFTCFLDTAKLNFIAITS